MKTAELASRLSLPMPDMKALLADLGIDPNQPEIDDKIAETMMETAGTITPKHHQLEGDEQTPEPTPESTPEPAKKKRGKLAKKESSEIKANTPGSLHQQRLSQALNASGELKRHILYSRLHQRFADGKQLGMIEALVEEQGRIEGKSAIQQTLFNTEVERERIILDEIMEELENTDFFGNSQTPQESYYKVAQVGASSVADFNQIITELAKI